MKLAHTTTLTLSKSEFVRHSQLSFFSKPMRVGMKKAKLLRVDKKKSKRANATALCYAANESTLTLNKMNTYEKVLFNAFQCRLYIGCVPQVE